MSHATKILITCCDDLIAHVGAVKNRDAVTPNKVWAAMINRLLDTRSALMAVRDAEPKTKPQPKTHTP